ncbi:glycoside hydrolase family protein [Noviherbaspirillum aerium]|uniref:glycoside hydrolase family protein n=1 Tax=Noviherbaspirillum aerium TaxID=2588497 RepID=UPI001CEF7C82|nr:peptidoglycan-binding protein [Noviherbaspirillum aerium]
MVAILRKGSTGTKVRELQEALAKHGEKLFIDGRFGAQTEGVVRGFQRRKGMLPDGIAGPKTFGALGLFASIGHPLHRARPSNDDAIRNIGGSVIHSSSAAKILPVPQGISRPSSALCTSHQGLSFIYGHEALAEVSNRLHWPRGASGVTLGPGYDMKERSAASVAADMQAIGLAASVARQIANAAGLANQAAAKFVEDHGSLVKLNRMQEMQLLRHVIPRYESLVKRMINIDLLQHEFDALVSFAYNPGGQFRTVAHQINEGHVANAMKTIRSVVTSKGVVFRGLVRRRDHEVALYLYGHYQGI